MWSCKQSATVDVFTALRSLGILAESMAIHCAQKPLKNSGEWIQWIMKYYEVGWVVPPIEDEVVPPVGYVASQEDIETS